MHKPKSGYKNQEDMRKTIVHEAGKRDKKGPSLSAAQKQKSCASQFEEYRYPQVQILGLCTKSKCKTRAVSSQKMPISV